MPREFDPVHFRHADVSQHDIDRVIICGLRANTCIEATMRWAAEAGYQVTLVKDAIAAFSLEEVRVAVEVNGPSYAAAIVTTETVVSAA